MRASASLLLALAALLPALPAVAAGQALPRYADPAPPSPFNLSGPAVQGGLVTGQAPAGTLSLALDGKPVAVAPDGRFLIGFDRDAEPGAMLVARLQGGKQAHQLLVVSKREWNISRLPTLPKFPVPAPEFQRLRAPELAQIAAARAIRSDSQGWRQRFAWPVTGRISTLFGSQRIYAGEPGAYHSGIDIARPAGTVVLAPADGVVTLAADAPFTLEGRLLMIDHGMGLNSAFMHLSRIDVRVGDVVRQGQPIGAVGMSGRATGPHLHWGLKWEDARIDPLLVAGAMPKD